MGNGAVSIALRDRTRVAPVSDVDTGVVFGERRARIVRRDGDLVETFALRVATSGTFRRTSAHECVCQRRAVPVSRTRVALPAQDFNRSAAHASTRGTLIWTDYSRPE